MRCYLVSLAYDRLGYSAAFDGEVLRMISPQSIKEILEISKAALRPSNKDSGYHRSPELLLLRLKCIVNNLGQCSRRIVSMRTPC